MSSRFHVSSSKLARRMGPVRARGCAFFLESAPPISIHCDRREKPGRNSWFLGKNLGNFLERVGGVLVGSERIGGSIVSGVNTEAQRRRGDGACLGRFWRWDGDWWV